MNKIFLTFNVVDQMVYRTDTQIVAAGTRNVYHARFSFNGSWDGIAKTAIFKRGESNRPAEIDENGECEIPWEVIDQPGEFYVGAMGGILMTTSSAEVLILQAVVDGDYPTEPTPSLIAGAIVETRKYRDAAAKSAEEAEQSAMACNENKNFAQEAAGISNAAAQRANKSATDVAKAFAESLGLTDGKFLSINYCGTSNESVNGITPALCGNMKFEYDDEISQIVAYFDGSTMLTYDIPLSAYERMQNQYTFEIFVNVHGGANNSLGMIAGTSWHSNNSGISLCVNSAGAIGIDGEMSIVSSQNPLGIYDTLQISDNSDYKSKWMHIVYVHGLDEHTVYVNGEIAKSGECDVTIHDTKRGFRVGALCGDAQFGFVGKIAFIKAYAKAATLNEIKAMHTACTADTQTLANIYALTLKNYMNKSYINKNASEAAVAEIKDIIKPVDELPADAADHPNTLYFVVEEDGS